jgi:hypothetical protein
MENQINVITKKTCSRCGKEKPISEFRKRPERKSGYQSQCKTCQYSYYKQRYYKNKQSLTPLILHTKKKCARCGQEKSVKEFKKNPGSSDGYQSHCRKCANEAYNERYYETSNPKYRIYRYKIIDGRKRCRLCGQEKPLGEFRKNKKCTGGRDTVCNSCVATQKKIKQAEFKERVVLFMGGKCVKCGLQTDHYEVYDCHHINYEEKEFNVTTMFGKKWEIVVLELNKCILLCANCHGSLTKQISRAKPISYKGQERYRRKQDAHQQRCIDYIGGRCQICGLVTEDYACYDFHHIDQTTKLYNIGVLINKDWDTVVKPELDKCGLLCANCHREIHAGRYDSIDLVTSQRIGNQERIK